MRDDSPSEGARAVRVAANEDTDRIKSVRPREVLSMGNLQPTPMMRNVTIIPDGYGKVCTRDCLTDMGCTQSLISEDIVRDNGMRVDTKLNKKIKAVNDQKLECLGAVTFTAGEIHGRLS